jgi:hypothetical protein
MRGEGGFFCLFFLAVPPSLTVADALCVAVAAASSKEGLSSDFSAIFGKWWHSMIFLFK